MTGIAAGDGFTVRSYDSVGSTNDLARELADAGAAAGTLVMAGEQTGGRGRHGRSWHSPRGNFYGSLILRPTVPLAETATLSLVIGLAVLDAVEAVAGRRLDLVVKWPNDVLLDGAKLAGILLEGATDSKGGCAWVIAGVGVNLQHHPDSPVYPSTSLAEAGVAEASPERFRDAFLAALGKALPLWERDGFAAFRDRWLARAAGLGRPVRLRVGDEVHAGKLADLGLDGSILIENSAGCLERFTAGELFFGAGTSG
ncbi:MAG: biotin--[acetyl-CoA-carboxylase] ligase [Geminicoccaceae bacterium]